MRALLRRMFDAAIDAAQPALCVPPHLPRAAARPAGGDRRRQGLGSDGACGRGPLGRRAVRAGRHALRLQRAMSPHRDRRGGASGARCRWPCRRRAHPAHGAGAGARRPGAVPDLRRRVGAAGAAAARPDARRQAGGQSGAAEIGCHDPGDELRATASVGHQGRTARGRLSPGADRHAADLRRAGRRSGRHRLGTDRCRSDHVRRCAGDTQTPRYQRAAQRAASARERTRRESEAGRRASGRRAKPA